MSLKVFFLSFFLDVVDRNLEDMKRWLIFAPVVRLK